MITFYTTFIILWIILLVLSIIFEKGILIFISGCCLLYTIYKLDILINKTSFKPEYQIELLNQTDIIIKTESKLDTIKFDSINSYIIKDNL